MSCSYIHHCLEICQLFRWNKKFLLRLRTPKSIHMVCICKTLPTPQLSGIIVFKAAGDFNISGHHFSLEPDNSPLPFLPPSFVILQHFIEAEGRRTESWHQFWLSLERDVNTPLKTFVLLHSLCTLCPYSSHGNLASAARASVTTWLEVP